MKTPVIIPYQELLGNYDYIYCNSLHIFIIPYQELLGNYDDKSSILIITYIIPYQELLGNYDINPLRGIITVDYTIPRAIREL